MSVFAADEQKLLYVSGDWTTEDLLNQEAIFFLKDVAKALKINSQVVKRLAISLEAQGQASWPVIGATRVLGQWIVRMTVFSVWYRGSAFYRAKKPAQAWDGVRLLQEDGMFLLNDVCALMPVSSNMIRARIRKDTPNKTRCELGVWKDEETGLFLVEMELFAKWIRRIWGDLIPAQGTTLLKNRCQKTQKPE